MGLNFNGTSVTAVNYNSTDLTKVIYNGTTVWEVAPLYDNYLFLLGTTGSTVKLIQVGTPAFTKNFAYSKDKINWTNFSFSAAGDGPTITFESDFQRIYFRGNNQYVSSSYSERCQFVMTGYVEAGGDINTLLSYNELITDLRNKSNCYTTLFKNCTALYWPPELPATSLGSGCYAYMFEGCTSLTKPPVLPATSLISDCYYAMFKDCTSLTRAPKLPALNVYIGCYNFMFYNCTSLQVNDSTSSGFSNAWRMPTSGTFNNTTTQNYMFYNCAGTRSTDSPTFLSGSSITYYTQSSPV